MSATATLPLRPSRVTSWTRLDDEALAGRAAAGDDGAFSALYERYHGPLLGYTRSILRDVEDASDATQNALEKALRALPSRDRSRPLRPWLYTIAHNEAIAIMRRRRPQTELQPAFEPTVPGPEVDAEQRGRLEQLVDDLQSLPERQRGALVMRELNGLSYEEIGTALGMTIEAARRAVFDARSALHAAVDGRNTACTSVRVCISDGDRRSLRARSVRAHLRSCNDCASFQRSIGARRADLHLLAPWVSGVALMGALGVGVGGVGGGALLAAGSGVTASAGGGAAAAAGGGLGWASLPAAIKGLAVAAAVAGTGTAAVEIKHAAQPERSTPQAQVQAASTDAEGASGAALRAASRAAAAAAAATPEPVAVRTANSVRSTTSGSRSSSASSSRPSKSHAETPTLAPPAAATRPATPATPKPQAAAPVVAAPAQGEQEAAIVKLESLQEQVRKAFADAQAVAGGGSQEGLALATGLLDATLGPLRASIDKVLAAFGLSLPASSAPAPAPSALQATTTNVLAPVQSVLTGIQSLMQQLLGQG